MEILVELDNVSKSYEAKAAVRDLSLKIEAGSMFGLLGPNGAGKTSTIRMMIGITLPDAGKVSLFGKPFGERCAEAGGLSAGRARALQEDEGDRPAGVSGASCAGWGRLEAKRRAKLWCERLQIADSIDKKTEELSKGCSRRSSSSRRCCTIRN